MQAEFFFKKGVFAKKLKYGYDYLGIPNFNQKHFKMSRLIELKCK